MARMPTVYGGFSSIILFNTYRHLHEVGPSIRT